MFPGREPVPDFLESYALRFDVPVRTSTRVDRLDAHFGGGFTAMLGAEGEPLRQVPVSTPVPTATKRCSTRLLQPIRRSWCSEPGGTVAWLSARRGHRAIGAVYGPGRDRYGNGVRRVMGGRYDVLVHIDRASPLHMRHAAATGDEQETYRWAV